MPRRLPTNLVALLLAICFGVILPTHDHASHQVCEPDGQSLADADHCHHHTDTDADHDSHSDQDGDRDHHKHHRHHCSICYSFSGYAHLTAAPHPLTSLDLLGLTTLPAPPTPYVASPAHSHPGRDPPSLI